MADDVREAERREDGLSTELLDKYFDLFKHMTTLNVATAVIVLAISQSSPIALGGVLATLSILGFSLYGALLGMEVVLECVRRMGDVDDIRVRVFFGRRRIEAEKYLNRWMWLSMSSFVGGLIGFGFNVLGE